MFEQLQLLAEENVATIRDIQKNPSQALKNVTRIIRNGKTYGFFFSQIELADILEDLEAEFSPVFKKKIAAGKKQIASGKSVSLAELKKRYGL